jgi:hypothetical protein
MGNCRARAAPANLKSRSSQLAAPCDFVIICFSIGSELPRTVVMKRYSLLIGITIAAVTCSSLLAEDRAALPPNGTMPSVLQGNTGKTVELRLSSGEKIGGKVEQVNDNLVLLSHITGAEFFDGFVNLKDISAVVIRSAAK